MGKIYEEFRRSRPHALDNVKTHTSSTELIEIYRLIYVFILGSEFRQILRGFTQELAF